MFGEALEAGGPLLGWMEHVLKRPVSSDPALPAARSHTSKGAVTEPRA